MKADGTRQRANGNGLSPLLGIYRSSEVRACLGLDNVKEYVKIYHVSQEDAQIKNQ